MTMKLVFRKRQNEPDAASGDGNTAWCWQVHSAVRVSKYLINVYASYTITDSL